MANTFIDRDFESIEEIAGHYGPVYLCRSNDFGKFYITDDCFRMISNTEEIKLEYFKVRALLREKYLSNKQILLCCDYETERLFNFKGGTTEIIGFSEMIYMFPRNLVDRQSRALVNLSRIEPDYGSEISSLKNIY